MVSGKNMPSSFEVASINVTSSIEALASDKDKPSAFEIEDARATSPIEAMASEKGKPSAFEIEDVRATSPIEVTALPDIPTSSASEEEEDQKPDDDCPPDGGAFAWMQVLGGWILVLNSRGMTNTFGAFQTYYVNNLLQTTSPSTISWIGSIQTFTMMFVGVFSGRLLDAGYLRPQLCVGIFLEILGLVMASFSTKYWELLVSQGLCVGLGAGLLYLPGVAVPAQYFSSKVMLATGIVATGSSMAGVVYPILIRQLLPMVGFSWTIRCLSMVILTANGTCLVLMQPRLRRGMSKPFTFNISMFLDAPYILFVLAMTFLFASVYIPYFYLPDYVRSQTQDSRLALYILSIMNAASFFGRILPSWLADWNRINKLVLVSVTCLLSGVTVASWLSTHNKAGTVAFSVTYGFISGGLVSLPPPTVATLSKNQDEYSTRMGMAFTICSLGALVGNPIAGALIGGRSTPTKESFVGPWLFAGGTMMAAAALAMAAYRLHNRSGRDSGRSSRGGSLERRSSSKWFQSLASEALTMQGAAFAL